MLELPNSIRKAEAKKKKHTTTSIRRENGMEQHAIDLSGEQKRMAYGWENCERIKLCEQIRSVFAAAVPYLDDHLTTPWMYRMEYVLYGKLDDCLLHGHTKYIEKIARILHSSYVCAFWLFAVRNDNRYVANNVVCVCECDTWIEAHETRFMRYGLRLLCELITIQYYTIFIHNMTDMRR